MKTDSGVSMVPIVPMCPIERTWLYGRAVLTQNCDINPAGKD